MSNVAQVIFALAFLIWTIRCPRDSVNYKLPSIQIGSWKKTKPDED